jgi:hypothetical protein
VFQLKVGAWNDAFGQKLTKLDKIQMEQQAFSMEQNILDTNAGKQLPLAATDIYLTLVLKKWTAFKYGLELWPPDVSK